MRRVDEAVEGLVVVDLGVVDEAVAAPGGLRVRVHVVALNGGVLPAAREDVVDRDAGACSAQRRRAVLDRARPVVQVRRLGLVLGDLDGAHERCQHRRLEAARRRGCVHLLCGGEHADDLAVAAVVVQVGQAVESSRA